MSRFLGAKNYGLWNYNSTVVMIFASFASLGIDRLILRDLDTLDCRNSVFSAHFNLKFLFSLIASIFIFIVIKMSDSVFIDYRILITFYIVLFLQVLDGVDLLLLSKGKIVHIIKSRLIVYILAFILKLYFIKNESIAGLCFSLILESLILFCLNAKYSFDEKVFPLHFDISFIKKYMVEGAPLFLSLCTEVFYLKIYYILLTHLLSTTDYGVMSMALKLIEVPQMLAYLGTVGFISELNKAFHDKKSYEALLVKRVKEWTILGIVISFFSIFVIHYSLPIIFKNEKIDLLLKYFPILCLSLIFNFNGAYRATHLTCTSKTKDILIINLVSILFNIFLFYLLVSRYHVLGAFVSYFISSMIMYFISSVLTRSSREYLKIQSLFPVLGIKDSRWK